MKVNELIEKISIDFEKAMKLIEYKEYLPIADKYILATTCADACIGVDRNGVHSLDTFSLHMAFTINMITTYTNLEIELEESFTAYDALCTSGAMTTIMENIEGEYGAVQQIMNSYISDKLSYENSTAKILAEGIEALYSSIGETGKELIGTLNGVVESVDMDKLNKLMSKVK